MNQKGFSNIVLIVIIAIIALGGSVLARKYLTQKSPSQNQSPVVSETRTENEPEAQLNTEQTTKPPAEKIALLSPNGGETLKLETQHTIKWEMDDSCSDKVSIGLVDPSANKRPSDRLASFHYLVGPLLLSKLGTNEYQWTVGEKNPPTATGDIPAGEYEMKVCVLDISPICAGKFPFPSESTLSVVQTDGEEVINVGSAGGTAIVGSGKVALIFPEDSVEKDASLRVKKGNHKHANEGYYLVVPDLVYEFYPTDFRFTKPVQIIMSYAGMQIPEKPGVAGAQLFRVIGNGHDGVLDFKLDPANKTVSGVIRNLGLYALEVENPEPPPANGMDREIFAGFGVEACDLSDNTFTIEN